MLRCNTRQGLATVIAEELSAGGKSIVRVLLDSNGEERVFLREFVSDSDTPVPQAAKKTRKPRATKPKPEKVSDRLLVKSCDEALTGKYDFSSGYESQVLDSTETV